MAPRLFGLFQSNLQESLTFAAQLHVRSFDHLGVCELDLARFGANFELVVGQFAPSLQYPLFLFLNLLDLSLVGQTK